ncbi:MAG: hypothetical protein HY791_30015 [Deltaproteobacteria bacterium]|nr:hypothetical protein [Deltaproteobacteria bacterium]
MRRSSGGWGRTHIVLAATVTIFVSLGKLMIWLGLPSETAEVLAGTAIVAGFVSLGAAQLRRFHRFLGGGERVPVVPLFGTKPAWLGASERARGSLSIGAHTTGGELSESTAAAGALTESESTAGSEETGPDPTHS